MNTQAISGIRVTQDRATGSAVETAKRPTLRDWFDDLLGAEAVSEAFVLQTCLRVELYVVAESVEAGRTRLSQVDFGIPEEVVVPMDHKESLQHLLYVTAGLDSFVSGEGEILGQVTDAFETAEKRGATGAILKTVLRKAIHLGKWARTETAINRGPTTIVSAALAVGEQERDLRESSVVVVGTDETGLHLVEGLALRDTEPIHVAGRTRPRRLEEQVPTSIQMIDTESLPTVLRDTDLVFVASDNHFSTAVFETLSDCESLVIVDITGTRTLPPTVSDRESVAIFDREDVQSFLETARQQRTEAANKIESAIEREVADLQATLKRQRVEDVIAGMYRGANQIKQRELSTAFTKLEQHGELTRAQREDVEALADTLVAHLLAPPTKSLREAAEHDEWHRIETAIELFDPHLDGVSDEIDLPSDRTDSPQRETPLEATRPPSESEIAQTRDE